jgi:hypothetical protein
VSSSSCAVTRSLSYPSASSYLSAIERRVEDVEETLQNVQRQITGLSSHGQGKGTDTISVEPSSINGTGQLEVQEVTETNDSVDGMGALVFANEEESGFFGERRTVSFITEKRRHSTH